MMVRLRSGLLLHPQWRGVAVIEDSEWHYPFFNTDMVRTVLSQAIEVLYYGYTPYISLKDRQEGETNWDTFFRQPFDCNLSCEWGGGEESILLFENETALRVLYYNALFSVALS